MNQPLAQPQDYERLERLSMIRDSAASLVPRDGDLKAVRALRFQALDRQRWQTLCDMGWPGILLPEDQGGIGLGVAEYVALLEELGRGLLPEPLIEAVLVAGLLPAELRTQLLQGDRLILPAALHEGGEVRFANGQASGRIDNVVLAGAADAFVVASAQGLLLVQATGLQITQQPTQDGGHQASLLLEGSAATPLPTTAMLELALDHAALGTAAYLLGCMQGAFERTLDYLKVRRQFGREIGSFQALQHRMVDLKIQVELSRALIDDCAARLDRGLDAADRARRVSAARWQATRAAQKVCREAIQLHGAIGYTDEADIGLFLRKVLTLMNANGTLEQHRQRYTAHVCAAAEAH